MSSVLTIAEAAEDLKVTPGRIWSWHRAGRLALLYTAGTGVDASRRGPRDARIDVEEWRRFKASLSVVRDAPAGPTAPEGPRRGRPPKGTPQDEGSGRWLKRYRAASE